MAKKKGRGGVVGSVLILAILAALGIGEFGLGGVGGGMVSDVFAPAQEETVVYEGDYAVKAVLDAGADKISTSSAAFRRPEVIEEMQNNWNPN